MGKDTQKPSVTRIILSDFTTALAMLIILVPWIMYIATAYFGFFPSLRGRDPLTGSDAPFFQNLGIIATLIGIPLLVWRVRSFQALFARGVEVPGRITNVWFHRDRGRIEYEYTYQDKKYSSGNAVMKSGRTNKFRNGDELVLIVDPENPKRALIRELYI